MFRPPKPAGFVGNPRGDGEKCMFLFGRNPRISIWCEQADHRRKCRLVDDVTARNIFQKPVPVARNLFSERLVESVAVITGGGI